MPKKLTDLVKERPEAQLAAMVKESASQIWLAGLGAFAKAQREGLKMFETLVAEGEKFQEKAKLETDERLADVRGKGDRRMGQAGAGVRRARCARAARLECSDPQGYRQLSKRVAELTVIAKKLSGELEAAEEAVEEARESPSATKTRLRTSAGGSRG